MRIDELGRIVCGLSPGNGTFKLLTPQLWDSESPWEVYFFFSQCFCIVFRPGDCLLALIYLLTQINNDQDCEYLRIIGLPKTTTHKAEKA